MSAAYGAAFEAIMASFSAFAADEILADARISFSLQNPRTVAWMEAHAAERVTGINETTREQIKKIMTQAAEEGWSYARAARAITAQFAEFSKPVPERHVENRAERVAITELAEAYGEAQRLVAQALAGAGLVMEKSWLTAAGACPLCVGNRSDGWIGLETAFASGAQRTPGHVSCRCTILYRRQEVNT
jgi:hypothetical protein